MVGSLNRQRVLNFLEVFYAGDVEGALSRCSDDVELIAPGPIDILPHISRHRGKDQVRKMWQTVLARYSDRRHELRDIVAEDDKVAVNIRAFFRKRWLSATAKAGESLSAARSITMISDRESDIYERFARRPVSAELIVRASWDRQSRQWIGLPSWFDDTSRTSTMVRPIVSGRAQ